MKGMNVGVLGATGAVGQEMLKILAERNFPVKSLRPLASARSAGKTILYKGEPVPIAEAKEDAFKGLDLVLGAAENDIAMRFAPHILDAGAVFVDNSSAFRLKEDVPLIVPEINPEDAKWHKGIIANPNCTTIVTLVAVAPLAKASPIETMVASSYQAVSGGELSQINQKKYRCAYSLRVNDSFDGVRIRFTDICYGMGLERPEYEVQIFGKIPIKEATRKL